MRRTIRAVTASAAAGTLICALLSVPANASEGSAPARQTGALPTLVPMDTGDGEMTEPVTEDAHPVESEVELVELSDAVVDDADQAQSADATDDGAGQSDESGVDEPGAAVAESADGATTATFSAPTPDLAVVGLSWDPGTAPDDLALRWRTQAEDGWSDWEEIHYDAAGTVDAHGVDEAVEGESAGDASQSEAQIGRDGTEPLLTIDATSVEIELTSDSGELPAGVTLAVIDPGESSADDAVSADAATTTTGTGGATTGIVGGASMQVPGVGDVAADPTTTATARPTIYSRGQWGADESIMTWTPSQGRVQGIDIHHTVNVNDYTSAQVPAIIRGIYAYHAQDWGRGWGDIGYNFLVDKFGRIWEGRYGGVDQAPIGAHATGLNSNFSGVSFIGNADTAAVPSAAFTAIAKIAAWKLALHGITTSAGKVTVEAGTFNRINGHRDSKQTTCPGRYLYDRLPELRTKINSYIGSFANRYLDRDLDGDGGPDLVAIDGSGTVSLISTVQQGDWKNMQVGSSWSAARTVDAGDWDGDGDPDLIHIRADGAMFLYPNDGSGRFHHETRWLIRIGWQKSDVVVGGVDVNSDGYPDLVARRTTGVLVMYLNDGDGLVRDSFTIGTGFQEMARLSLADDFVGGRPALLAEHPSTGRLLAYPLGADGHFTRSPIVVSNGGWAGMRLTTGVGDVTDDGIGDVLVVDSAQRLWLYPGKGTGGLYASQKVKLSQYWGAMEQLVGAGYKAGKPTYYTVDSSGRLVFRSYTLTADAFVTKKSTGIVAASGSRIVPAGDWNRDGIADLWVITRGGALMLHTGLGDGRFRSDGTRVGTGNWSIYAHVVGAGNWRGDGKPGLIAYQASTGKVWFYASDGDDFFLPRVLVSNGAEGMDYLVNAGLWNGPGAPDLLMRGADSGRLFFYDGNGPGLAFPPVAVASGWGSFGSIVGVNDVTYDGRADLVVSTTSGDLRLYAGNSTGGYGGYRVVGQLPAGTVLS